MGVALPCPLSAVAKVLNRQMCRSPPLPGLAGEKDLPCIHGCMVPASSIGDYPGSVKLIMRSVETKWGSHDRLVRVPTLMRKRYA